MTKWKVIKPGKFHGDAFERHFEQAAKKFKDLVLDDFESTTRTWNKKVKFQAEVKISKSRVSASVTTDNAIYRYVSVGTEPHVIKPKKKKRLLFRGTYRAKTTPGIIGSQSGGAEGPLIGAAIVHHPGTKGRKFEQAILAKREPDFLELVELALKNGTKDCGHAV